MLEQIAADGLDALPELMRLMINTAMHAERQQLLGVSPNERSPERRGHANDYTSKTISTRGGEVTFAVPHVREAASIRTRWSVGCAANER